MRPLDRVRVLVREDRTLAAAGASWLVGWFVLYLPNPGCREATPWSVLLKCLSQKLGYAGTVPLPAQRLITVEDSKISTSRPVAGHTFLPIIFLYRCPRRYVFRRQTYRFHLRCLDCNYHCLANRGHSRNCRNRDCLSSMVDSMQKTKKNQFW